MFKKCFFILQTSAGLSDNFDPPIQTNKKLNIIIHIIFTIVTII